MTSIVSDAGVFVVGIAGFFSGSEIAIISARRSRISRRSAVARRIQ